MRLEEFLNALENEGALVVTDQTDADDLFAGDFGNYIGSYSEMLSLLEELDEQGYITSFDYDIAYGWIWDDNVDEIEN